mmetsp:Transcript_17111/g.35742  ORF Transcript_17111/g.35742 Transcript_17111/m.35742 type:complete len:85 (+) Transcript_17111:440-694(+)
MAYCGWSSSARDALTCAGVDMCGFWFRGCCAAMSSSEPFRNWSADIFTVDGADAVAGPQGAGCGATDCADNAGKCVESVTAGMV